MDRRRPQKDTVHKIELTGNIILHHTGDPETVRLLRDMKTNQEKIMDQLDELRAAQQASLTKIDRLQTGIDGVQADVDALIARLGEVKPPIPQDVLDAANAINTKLDGLTSDVESTAKPPSATA